MLRRTFLTLGAAAVAGPVLARKLALPMPSLVYIGTYTGPRSRGIHAARVDPASGVVEFLCLVAETQNPSFLAVHPGGRFLYAANETGDYQGTSSGSVTAYEILRDSGGLRRLNTVSSRGGAPCHLVVDSTGRQVLVANYMGGNVASLPVREDGSLGEAGRVIGHIGSSVNPDRQKEPHAHSINLSPDNRFAVAADLGTDRLYVYPFDPATGLGEPALPHSPRMEPGSGPRHFAFHPGGRHAYAINELTSTVTAMRYEARRGRLVPFQTVSTLPDGHSGGNSTAQIVVHPGGRFVYGSNRGHDSIARFGVDPGSGRLTPLGHTPAGGRTPRNFNIEPGGRHLWVASQNSDLVRIFRIDPQTGDLHPTGQDLAVGSPVCVLFV